MSKTIVKVENVTKHYKPKGLGSSSKKSAIKAVDGVSFSIEKNEILGIIGESGCGKSTLARMLINLESPSSGNILIDGQNTNAISRADRLAFCRKVQLIFQNPYDIFDPRDSIRKILYSPLNLHNIGKDETEKQKICLEILEKAGMRPAEDYINRYPHELSGGQLQRISILRSMLLEPSFVVADEPVSMLDVSIRADIIHMLESLVRGKDACMVFISHDIATTRYISDKVAVMYLGRIVEYGKTDDVLHNPIHPYTQALISNSASLDPLEERKVIRIDGEPPTPVGTGPGCYFEPRCFMCKEKCASEYPPLVDAGGGHFYSCFYK